MSSFLVGKLGRTHRPHFDVIKRKFSVIVSVKGLHKNTDDVRLIESFEQYGSIKSHLLTYCTNDNFLTRDAIVEFDNIKAARLAITKMNGQELDGRLLRVDFYDEKKDKSDV